MHIKLERKHWIALAVIAALLILAIIAALTIPRLTLRPRLAQEYHVDSHASPGGDGSLARPWNSIADHVIDLQPDDVMFIHPGTYHEDRISLSQSGTSDAPITIRAYDGDNRPVILPNDPLGLTIQLYQANYWVIESLILDRLGGGGVAIEFKRSDHNILRNCEIRSGDYVGVLINEADHNTVEDCSVHHFIGRPGYDAQGIQLNDRSHNNLITDNEIYNNTNGILFYIPNSATPGDYDVSGNVIENNRLWVSPDLAPCAEQLIDIKMGAPIIRGNIMFGARYCDGHCGGTGAAGAAAVAIHGQLGDHVIVEDNVIFDSTCGIRVYDHSPTGTTLTIRRNLIHSQLRDESWCHSAIECQIGSYDIYNNTIINSPDHYAITVNYGTTINIHSNLLYNTSRPKLYNPPANITADYNGYFIDLSELQPEFRGTHDTAGTDPLLTANYRLTENSLARGAGQYGVDLGAFPYAPITPTPTPELTPITSSPSPTATSPTPTGQWWQTCTPCPPQPIQPTLTPNPPPTCQPCNTATPYPTHTPYPPQP